MFGHGISLHTSSVSHRNVDGAGAESSCCANAIRICAGQTQPLKKKYKQKNKRVQDSKFHQEMQGYTYQCKHQPWVATKAARMKGEQGLKKARIQRPPELSLINCRLDAVEGGPA
jgi:DNA polymerase sigma